jgi:glycerol-3-phosphate acyltransferase PlsY
MAKEFLSILFVFLAYLLGSFPSGYLITRLFIGKNILEIGWRKTSGSNVFLNVGFFPGLLTGILDLGKGALAVWLAQNFELPLLIQVLCGVAAIVGHNWSLFLKFAGGRGIGTLIGALLILAPKLLGFSLLFFLFFTLIFNSSIATIIFLISIIFLSFYFQQIESAGLLVFFSFWPIFIKRLSPIREIFPLSKKKNLIKNRLLFDNDEERPIRFLNLFKKIKSYAF